MSTPADGTSGPVPLAVPAPVERFGAPGPRSEGPDLVAVEAPLALDLEFTDSADEPHRARVMTTLRTPGHDVELAIGWLASEGVIAAADDVISAVPCAAAAAEGRDVLRVRLRLGVRVDLQRTVRIGTLTAACGACGRPEDATASAGERRPGPVRRLGAPAAFPLEVLLASPDRMLGEQVGFRHSGGLHAAALVARDGRLLVVREDVGRHNAVDKVIGAWLAGTPSFPDAALVVTSRAGFEIVQKAASVGIPLVAAVGAASSLAIETAAAAGVTLAGFLRAGRCSVYAHADGLGTNGGATPQEGPP